MIKITKLLQLFRGNKNDRVPKDVEPAGSVPEQKQEPEGGETKRSGKVTIIFPYKGGTTREPKK